MNQELTPYNPPNNGGSSVIDFDGGSTQDMHKRLADMKNKLALVQQFFKDIMVKDEDYGTIPGTGKPSLYKPGAEKLCELYNFAAHVKSKEEEKNYDNGWYRAIIIIQLVHRSTGQIVGESIGECNVYESKYRYRWLAEYKLPKGIDKESLFSEEKTKFKDGKPTDETYMMYRVENEDLFSQWNTCLKMAYKRAYVAVTLMCTRSSGIFTMEENEMDEYADVPEADRKKKNQRGSGNQGAGASPKASSSPAGGTAGGTSGGTSTGTGITAAKKRALDLMKTAEMNWNDLAAQATETLGRPVKKVIDDIKTEADWNLVSGALETLIESRGAFDEDKDELDFEKLPDHLKG